MVGFLYWLILDIFYKFEVKIKWENYIVRECLFLSEVDLLCDLDVCELYYGGFFNFVYLLCENVYKNRILSFVGSRLSVNLV